MNRSEENFVNELKARGYALEEKCRLLSKKIRDLKGYLNVLEKTSITNEEMDIITRIQVYLKGAEDE